MNLVSWSEFEKIDMRVGTIIAIEDFPQARNPAYILQIDFGKEMGKKKSSAQITDLYSKTDLIGKQIIAVTNFPAKQIGPMMSECLVTGFYQSDGSVVLAVPDKSVSNGAQLG